MKHVLTFWQWYRLSLPPRMLTIVGIGGLVVSQSVPIAFWLTLPSNTTPAEVPELWKFLLVPAMFSTMLALLFGGHRSTRLPEPGSDYANWLMRTAWTPEHRTPFGPWRPMWWDLIPIGLLTIVAASNGWWLHHGFESSKLALNLSLIHI